MQAQFDSPSEFFYHDFVRKIVSEYLGEESAKEADAHPFQYINPAQVAALYKVGLRRQPSILPSSAHDPHASHPHCFIAVYFCKQCMGYAKSYLKTMAHMGPTYRHVLLDAENSGTPSCRAS